MFIVYIYRKKPMDNIRQFHLSEQDSLKEVEHIVNCYAIDDRTKVNIAISMLISIKYLAYNLNFNLN